MTLTRLSLPDSLLGTLLGLVVPLPVWLYVLHWSPAQIITCSIGGAIGSAIYRALASHPASSPNPGQRGGLIMNDDHLERINRDRAHRGLPPHAGGHNHLGAELDAWRVQHGAPPWRGWRYAPEDVFVMTALWVVLAIALNTLSVRAFVAVLVSFMLVVVAARISRAANRRRD